LIISRRVLLPLMMLPAARVPRKRRRNNLPVVAAAAVTSDAASLVSFLRTNASIARSIGPLLPNMTRRAASTTKHRFARSAEESTECEIQSEIEAELTMNG
jgi:hypothetical protein